MKAVYGLSVRNAEKSLTRSKLSMIRVLKQVSPFSTDSEELFECRQCGTSLDEGQESCPECGCQDIACYEL
jgi:rubrerythrin